MTTFPLFLCDTWWFALTKRLDDKQFEEIATLRVKQGFTAIQLVVGIPPEVGPDNLNAASPYGPAWNLKGEFNEEYLDFAKARIKLLNSLGLKVIVYGAWGHQIEWLGVPKMKEWWRSIVKSLDDLDVMYCLTGEIDLWISEEGRLLPDKSTDDLHSTKVRYFLHPRIKDLLTRLSGKYRHLITNRQIEVRKRRWSEVLSCLHGLTDKPIIIHVARGTSNEAVSNNQFLSAVTIQTGHSEESRQSLYQIPYELKKRDPRVKFINLEPWYEGIMDKFGTEDQLYAYWVTMMAGADSYCYGAHGVWNIGDGKFLSHWGEQTLEEAIELDTPRLLGISHKLFLDSKLTEYPETKVVEHSEKLHSISKSSGKKRVTFYPDASSVRIEYDSKLRFFDPLIGRFTKERPSKGQIVVFEDF